MKRSTLVYPLRGLYGGSFKTFISRFRRLKNLAASMQQASLTPPLPTLLQIETTDKCNLKCRMCTRKILDDLNTISMPLSDFIGLINAIDPYSVVLNGIGEPLLDKTIFEKLAYLHSHNIMTSMPTNGTYIRRDKLEKLAEHLPDILRLSIDGATKDSFEYVREKSQFARIIENYKAIVFKNLQGQTRGGTIRIKCTLQKANLYDYEPMFTLVKSLHCLNHFSLEPVFDFDSEGNAFASVIPTSSEIQMLHKSIDKSIVDAKSNEERKFYQQWKKVSSYWLETHEPHSINQANRNAACLMPWYSTYVDAKGKVYPCCYLINSEYVMGNINEQSFQEIWYGPKYKSFRAQVSHARSDILGCDICIINHDNALKWLNKIRIFLPIS